ncbi:YegS/Rv2252/BmrU family lipid kinase [Roseisolibacter sp. H3M3-2]|uniref:YegS/Rv2252/BmrU family lipid kinase n=1 Tax=Roseisolibacter sp. H3M3-2 TaxID=3031323 RepID=UPI0023DB8476|nr:YegS/Rv2252/BmrU family lipid kinase [Roseisolibacter sp. H3M3-2]MDF1504755.1 YegS/Rv2252/BmrU family lipid kinase [Roseisolibacter sp. H3M3-2]
MAFGRTFDLVIHGARADDPGLRAAAEWARTIGHRIRAHVTWEAGDARRFAAEAAERGSDAVLAVGGDGTVNEVINGLIGSTVPLGILPVGTANDFARQTGIPDDPRAALELVIERPPVTVDLGTLNGRAFLNVSSAGLGAETTAETGAVAKGVLGPLAYAITGVRKLAGEMSAYRARVEGPGFARDVEFLALAVGNARATGAGTVITPLARLDDGLLDVCVVAPMALGELAGLMLELRRGEHLERDGVLYAQVPWLRVESETPLTVNLDGEPQALTRLEYAVSPAALRVHVAHLPGEGPE